MIKSLVAANRSEKEKFRIPKSVQQSIPIRRIYTDGIWQVGNKHSKTWRFADINYAAASEFSTASPQTPPPKSPSSTAG